MTNASPKRRIRWQFSLRGLLLVITLAAVGLVFYSPTWEEPIDVNDSYNFGGYIYLKPIGGTVTYRRGWDRKRVKHGWTYVDYQNACRLEALFENDELRQLRQLRNGQRVEETFFQGGTTRKRTFSSGQLTKDITYYSGSKMHGKFWSNEKGTLNSGSYLNDEREGVWNFTFPNGATVSGLYRDGQKDGTWHTVTPTGTIEANYQADKLHGRKRWLTPTGRELQTADYVEDKLVGWNGKPLAEEVARWVEQEFAADPLLRINLLRADTKPESWKLRKLPNDETGCALDDSSLPVVVHGNVSPGPAPTNPSPLRRRILPNTLSNILNETMYRDPGRKQPQRFSEVLLACALLHDCTLQKRFGVLHIVAITEGDIDWQDLTGVADIHFPPGSLQEADWLSLGVLPIVYKDRTVDLMHRMFATRFGSPIVIDTSAVDDLEPPITETTHQIAETVPRIRRDLVGQYLDRAGFRCELRGEKLVILPQKK